MSQKQTSGAPGPAGGQGPTPAPGNAQGLGKVPNNPVLAKTPEQLTPEQLTPEQLTPEQLTPRELAGHNRISTQALTSVAKVAAARVLAVPAAQVRVGWNDEDGLLALSISSVISAPPLSAVSRDAARFLPEGSIIARATAAKARIQSQVEYLSGSRLSRVDVRISGLLMREDGRVS